MTWKTRKGKTKILTQVLRKGIEGDCNDSPFFTLLQTFSREFWYLEVYLH